MVFAYVPINNAICQLSKQFRKTNESKSKITFIIGYVVQHQKCQHFYGTRNKATTGQVNGFREKCQQ